MIISKSIRPWEEQQQQAFWCQLFFLSSPSLDVLLVRHLASAPTTDNSGSTLASPRWAMATVFVLREQFKCRAKGKGARAHDRQIYILISKMLPPPLERFNWTVIKMRKLWSCRAESLLLHINMNVKLYRFKFLPHPQSRTLGLLFECRAAAFGSHRCRLLL